MLAPIEYSHDEFVKVRHHLSNVLKQHSSLLEKVTDEDLQTADHSEKEEVYRTLSRLDPVVKLAKQLGCKEKVTHWIDDNYVIMCMLAVG